MTARKDNRPLVKLSYCTVAWNHSGHYAWEAIIDEQGIILAVGDYTRRASAKRGMLRFLQRIGADPASVRWEGEV